MGTAYISKKILLSENGMIDAEQGYHAMLCGDEKYIKYVGVTITSIILALDKSHVPHFTFHIFCDSIMESDLDKLRTVARKYNTGIIVYFLERDALAKLPTDMKGSEQLSYATYFRILGLGILADLYQFERVVYFDSDLIALNGKIMDLWNVEFDESCIFMAVEDEHPEEKAQRISVDRYFNAGVCVANLRAWGNRNLTDVCLPEVKKNIYSLHDQDVLNIVMKKRVKFLPRCYNTIVDMNKLIDSEAESSSWNLDMEKAVVLHLAGIGKPWFLWMQYTLPARLYREVASRSVWKWDELVVSPKDREPRYKYLHKMARVNKKEGNRLLAAKYYYEYILWKIRFYLKK